MFMNNIVQNLKNLKTENQFLSSKMEYIISPDQYKDIVSPGGIYIGTLPRFPKVCYIGQALNFVSRWQKHNTQLINNIHCGYFQVFFNENHCTLDDIQWDILQKLPIDENDAKKTGDILDVYERAYIHKYEDEGYLLLNSITYKGDR